MSLTLATTGAFTLTSQALVSSTPFVVTIDPDGDVVISSAFKGGAGPDAGWTASAGTTIVVGKGAVVGSLLGPGRVLGAPESPATFTLNANGSVTMTLPGVNINTFSHSINVAGHRCDPYERARAARSASSSSSPLSADPAADPATDPAADPAAVTRFATPAGLTTLICKGACTVTANVASLTHVSAEGAALARVTVPAGHAALLLSARGSSHISLEGSRVDRLEVSTHGSSAVRSFCALEHLTVAAHGASTVQGEYHPRARVRERVLGVSTVSLRETDEGVPRPDRKRAK